MTREESIITMIQQKGSCRSPVNLRCGQGRGDDCPFRTQNGCDAGYLIGEEGDSREKRYYRLLEMYMQEHSKEELVAILL
jgi:hypothetical protein